MISLELDPKFNREPEDRYSRQVLFREIGAEGQRRLSASRIAIVGCGATGSALASLLARAGVGLIRIIDRDYVESSNLQRQSLFDESDAAESMPKAIAAARKIGAFNSQIAVESQVADLTALAEEVGADLKKFCQYYKIDKLENLPASSYASAVKAFQKKRRA